MDDTWFVQSDITIQFCSYYLFIEYSACASSSSPSEISSCGCVPYLVDEERVVVDVVVVLVVWLGGCTVGAVAEWTFALTFSLASCIFSPIVFFTSVFSCSVYPPVASDVVVFVCLYSTMIIFCVIVLACACACDVWYLLCFSDKRLTRKCRCIYRCISALLFTVHEQKIIQRHRNKSMNNENITHFQHLAKISTYNIIEWGSEAKSMRFPYSAGEETSYRPLPNNRSSHDSWQDNITTTPLQTASLLQQEANKPSN